MIHVSDLIRYKKCPRSCWSVYHKKGSFESFYHLDVPFKQLWSDYYQLDDCASGHVGDTNEVSMRLLQENEVVRQVRLEYRGCRTKIPLLQKVENGYRAIYPHLSAYPKESEAVVMKINKTIASHLGIDIVEHTILYLNKDYVRKDGLDLHSCFLESDCLFNRRNRIGKTIDECMDHIELDLDAWIDEVIECVSSENIEPVLSKTCTSNRRCMFYQDCFDESQLPDNSILFLTTSKNKIEAYKEGIVHIHELPINQLDGFRLQYAQVQASKQGRFVDHSALHDWLRHVEYPVSYLDFEWDTFAVPPYVGMKPFDVLCFQYSLHIEGEHGQLEHKDFFEQGDCRRHFVESLLESVPKKGSILVYNMEGAEKLRLVQLSKQFPEYAKDLEQIWSRMIDLSKPFEAGLVYDNRMRGHYSLKSVLPVFTDEYSYSKLSIQDGLNAVHSYRTFASASKSEQRQIRKDIRTYCSMDTFAEYIVFQGLRQIDREVF